MLDIGWSEILVIAIVLIVVVGPKDLPPMIRAFGKMTANLRKMAGEFRSQFDEALKEADMDDVRRTIADARKLNPTNSLRDAMNPLRQLGNDIKSDLHKATSVSSDTATAAKAETPFTVPEPAMKLPDSPPVVVETPVAPAPTAASATAPTAVSVAPVAAKAAKVKAASIKAEPKAGDGVAKPKRATKSAAAAPTSVSMPQKPARAKPAPKAKPVIDTAALNEVGAKVEKAAKAAVAKKPATGKKTVAAKLPAAEKTIETAKKDQA